jgi:hypothetical protein
VVEIQVLEGSDMETISTSKSLLLTENGGILVWSAIYDRPIGSSKLCQWTGGRDEVATESKFEIFDEKKLKDALSQSHLWNVDWGKVFRKILHRLSDEMKACIIERQGYIQSMIDSHDILRMTLRRIL